MRRPALLVLAPLLPAALIAAPAQAAPSDEVSLAFSTISDGRSSSVSLANDGTASTSSRLVTSGGGTATVAASAASTSGAVQLPAYTNGSATAPRAVVAVTNSGAGDALNPVGAPFAFGADVRLDATSQGGSADNGNNVIQRGLYDASSQFKIQIDSGSTSCRVKGTSGALEVGLPLPSQSWYRLSCSLTPGSTTGTVTLTATPLAADGSLGTTRTASRSGRVGSLSYPAATPLSVGGKLSNTGTLQASADQFNGRIDNAWLRIG